MRKSIVQRTLVLVVSCCAVSGLQLFWHWFIAVSQSTPAVTVLLIYISRDNQSGKGFFPIVDIIIPSLVLGVVLGRVGKGWPFRGLLAGVLFVSANVVALTLVYPLFFADGTLWWARSPYPSMGNLFLTLFETTILAAFGCFVGSVAFEKKDNGGGGWSGL